jgi:hypothetical protein
LEAARARASGVEAEAVAEVGLVVFSASTVTFSLLLNFFPPLLRVSAFGRIERDFRICRPFAFALHHFMFHFSIREKESWELALTLPRTTIYREKEKDVPLLPAPSPPYSWLLYSSFFFALKERKKKKIIVIIIREAASWSPEVMTMDCEGFMRNQLNAT